jgi:uncharacterized membrane protein YraQ (UPF0718 family)
VLPAAASFKKQGANKGALASFLVSTPESGIDSIAITYALLDPIMTIVRPVAAFVTGIFAGILENTFSFDQSRNEREEPDSTIDGCCSQNQDNNQDADARPAGFMPKVTAGLKYGCDDVWGDIVFWFFAGLLVAGIITVFIPDNISEMVLGGGLLSMLTMLLIGMPLYICATASTPVAAALLLKGASPGAVLVFLLAGPATNMTSLSVLTRILGKSGTVRYLLVIAFSSILFGLGVDWLYEFLAIEPRAIMQEARETMPDTVKLLSALIILILSLYHPLSWVKKKWNRKKDSNSFVTGFPSLDPVKQKPSLDKHSYTKKLKH